MIFNRLFHLLLTLTIISLLSACGGSSTPSTTVNDCPPGTTDPDCPVLVMEPGAPTPTPDTDTDKDGVLNPADECPNTAPQAMVNSLGCSAVQLDIDQDQVANAQDLCPQTPANSRVDASGCAITQMVAVEAFGINAGSALYYGNDNTLYAADTHFKNGSVSVKDKPIANTQDDPIFNSLRFGNFTYAIPVKGETSYTVELLFNETFWDANNQRLQDVFIEGDKVLEQLDIHATAGGKNIAFTKAFSFLAIEDEVVNIEFKTLKNNASVAGIKMIRLAPATADDDQDGVNNSDDKCYLTPSETPVDSTGCTTALANIVTVNLIDAVTDQVIAEIVDDQIIDLAALPNRFISIEAITSSATRSVKYDVNDNTTLITNGAPFSIAGQGPDIKDYNPWAAGQGDFTVNISAYKKFNANGTPDTTKTLKFSIIDSASAPQPKATYHGKKPFRSFNNGTIVEHAWSLDKIVYYTWDDVSQENADRWLTWYQQCNGLYEKVLDRAAYLENDANFGSKKVLAVVDASPMLCGTVNAAGCGNKLKAQASRGYATSAANAPNSVLPHWILYYEMGRGGRAEPFYKKGIWPKTGWSAGMPHTMAGICMHSLGGNSTLESTGSTPGRLLERLNKWENDTLKFHETFITGSSQGYNPHDLVAAMMYRILQAESPNTIRDIFKEIAKKPERDTPKQAMCDFVASVNAVTDKFSARLIGPWGMPNDCAS
ncbi:malectin domain-containing carbohydrate-binding protein [Marinagarivorans algicola]|uniref:malectin domain-containing carbohydrate-binding protein n=1 Tax=Marinagarivorans algicola TaxID=1513270 RepID=UPI0012E2BE7B|nr:malectin domain-containing carbohydrate-binding protein [Marinagarivorans algicola]